MRPNFEKSSAKEVVVKEVEKQTQMVSMDQVESIIADRVEKSLAVQHKEVPVKQEKEEEYTGVSSKMVKELQGIAGVFNALKEFSANPLQTAIEQKVGVVAASAIDRLFTPPQQPQDQDIIGRILNSQLGAGLGAGLGQRGPEVIDKLFGLFGKEKVDGWIGGAIAGRGEGMGGGIGGGIPGQQGQRQGGGNQQSEVDLILGLDPNNPEHIAAYAQSQGGIPLDVARKMLMVHQDAFIKNGRGSVSNDIGNVQEYRRPVAHVSYADEQNLDVEKQKIDTEIKSRQIEPDALVTIDVTHPQMKPEDIVFETGQNEEQEQIQQQEQQQQLQPDETNQILRQLSEMMTTQNAVILDLRRELDILKEKDIEKTRNKMEKEDERLFAGVRKVKNVKMGNGNEKEK